MPVRQWKTDMSLISRDKEASRELALQLFPEKSELLR